MILPIGYQPFMRCSCQYGYGIKMKTPFSLQENVLFTKFRFRQNEQFSQQVFEMMDEGRKIYPEEGLSSFLREIDLIGSAESFSEEAFSMTLKKNERTALRDEYRERLEKFEVIVNGKKQGPFFVSADQHPAKVSRERIDAVNKLDVDFSIEKEYGITLNTRRCLTIESIIHEGTKRNKSGNREEKHGKCGIKKGSETTRIAEAQAKDDIEME